MGRGGEESRPCNHNRHYPEAPVCACLREAPPPEAFRRASASAKAVAGASLLVERSRMEEIRESFLRKDKLGHSKTETYLKLSQRSASRVVNPILRTIIGQDRIEKKLLLESLPTVLLSLSFKTTLALHLFFLLLTVGTNQL